MIVDQAVSAALWDLCCETEYEMEKQISEFNIMGLCTCHIYLEIFVENLLKKKQRKYNTKEFEICVSTELSDISSVK